MQNFRKIKQISNKQQQKIYARSQLQIKRKAQQKEEERLKESAIEMKNRQETLVIKNLDNNKLQIYQNQQQIENALLKQIYELPQIQKFLEQLWQKYLNQYQKEQQQFLQACYQGDVSSVKQCVSNKTKYPLDAKNCLTDQGKNGIHLATMSGSYRNLQIIRVLKQFGVDINGKTKHQYRTPLMLGVITANQLAVEQLLKLGADVSITDYQGNSALHHACIYNQQTITRFLLQYNPPFHIKNKRGQTPIDLSPPSILNIIKERPSKIPQFQINIDSKGQLQTEEGQLSGWVHSQKMQQIAIKNIGLSNFKKLSLLGRGAFGQVYLAQNSLDGLKYAVKVLDKGLIMRQNILRYAMTQRKILSTISHPFIVKLRYAFQTSQKLYLVMDYCPGGDLLAAVKRNGFLPEEHVKKYMAQIILAIQALHKAQIIYRDLKPSNIILDPQGHACLTDFGLSKQASLSHSFCGSTAYLAPQMLWRRGHTKVLDWYLLGVVIYQCLTGRPPFWDSNKQQLLANIKSGRYKPLSQQFSKQVRDIVQKLLSSNSSKRLGFNGSKQIKNHPWFSGVSWEVVEKRGLKMPEIIEGTGKVINQDYFVQQTGLQQDKIKGWDYNPHSK